MSSVHQIVGGWMGRRAGCEGRVRAPRPRRAPKVEALEGRALLSIYLVDSLGDSGAGAGPLGDLRYAIEQADQARGDSTIIFSPSLDGQTIALGSGMLRIDKPSGTLTIRGPGDTELAISGGHRSQLVTVLPGSRVSISGLTLMDGIATQGAGISNEGSLTMTDCTITGNSAMGGGGGGIVNGPLGTMTISASTIEDNVSSLASGGGIFNAGTMTIIQSTVNGNACRGGSTNGGGIANAGTMTIVDGTVSGNRALYGNGGGIANTSSLTLTDDTIGDNSAGTFGGGVANQADLGGIIAMENTIVANNVDRLDARTADVLDEVDPAGSGLVGGNDLIEAGDIGLLTNTVVGVAPQLGPLQNNGGPTWTQALLPGSPALGAGNPALVPTGIRTDQRGSGYARVVGGQVDIGAYEVQATRGTTLRAPLATPTGQPAATVLGLTIIPPTPSSQADRLHNGAAGAPVVGAA